MTRKLFERAVHLAGWAALVSLTITVIGVLLPGSDLPDNLPPTTTCMALDLACLRFLQLSRRGTGET